MLGRWKRGIQNAAINIGLAAASLLIALLFCEFMLFRVVLLPSDVPENAFANGLVRYAPHQSGIWRVRNEISAPYAINKQGWNSGVGDYAIERKPGVMQIGSTRLNSSHLGISYAVFCL